MDAHRQNSIRSQSPRAAAAAASGADYESDLLAEAAAEHSLSRLLESLPLIVFRLDRHLRFAHLSGAVEPLTGWPAEHFLGHTGSEAGVEERIWGGFAAACREVLATGQARRHAFGLAAASPGQHLEAQIFPELGAGGRIESLVGIASDASERKRSEDALRASEERYRALIAQVKNYAIFAVDLEGRASTWNEGVERVLGWSREEFIGLPTENLFAPEDIAAGVHRRELQQAAEEGSATSDRWLRRRDGTPFYASGTSSRVVDAAGHVVGFSKVLRDRTAWKLAQDERDTLLESERKARQDAESANRLKDEFLATLSHELRSPLNAIVGWVHVLRRHAQMNDEIVRGLEVIERNARAQTQIINDLLDMSRIMTGKVQLNVRTVSLHKVLGSALEAIRPAAEAKGIVITTALDPASDRLRADPNRLQQVMWNLLTNAVKFTPGGGRVQVSSERVDSSVEIRVQDSGVGINGAFLPHVFDRFRQADASTTRLYGGLGLGLSIVKNLVELHGGSVRARSPGEGLGATFVVRLPLPSAQKPAESPSADVPPPSALTLESLPRLTDVVALVVDDEVDSLVFCGRLLEERGAKVRLAVDAQQALETLRSEPVDILISDIGMAREDGYYLISQLRAMPEERAARLPAIAVTAYARSEDRQRLLLAGFQMHITKPIEPHELIAGIASLVGVTAHKPATRG